jgi:thioredoxin reductase (NADPH)
MANLPDLDLAIIGAGPSGLSAAAAAADAGLNYLVFERGLLANTVYNYPVGRTVFSTPEELEMLPGALHTAREKPTREELLSHYVRFAIDRDLRINCGEEVTAVTRVERDRFRIVTNRDEYHARRVLFTIGAMARLRRLDVPGEDLPKVHHRFVEPYPYVRKKAMVIGGGNSAAEAALFLAEDGAETTLAILRSDWENRDPKKGAIKHWVREPLEALLAQGKLTLQLIKNVVRITDGFVELEPDQGGRLKIENDVVFVLIGADADFGMLKELGVATVREGLLEFPVYDPETYETVVPGVYVAGHFTRARHIKDAIAVPRQIIPRIAQKLYESVE